MTTGSAEFRVAVGVAMKLEVNTNSTNLAISPAAVVLKGAEGDNFTLTFVADGLSFDPTPLTFPEGGTLPGQPLENVLMTIPSASSGEFVLNVEFIGTPVSQESTPFTIHTDRGTHDPSIVIDPPPI